MALTYKQLLFNVLAISDWYVGNELGSIVDKRKNTKHGWDEQAKELAKKAIAIESMNLNEGEKKEQLLIAMEGTIRTIRETFKGSPHFEIPFFGFLKRGSRLATTLEYLNTLATDNNTVATGLRQLHLLFAEMPSSRLAEIYVRDDENMKIFGSQVVKVNKLTVTIDNKYYGSLEQKVDNMPEVQTKIMDRYIVAHVFNQVIGFFEKESKKLSSFFMRGNWINLKKREFVNNCDVKLQSTSRAVDLLVSDDQVSSTSKNLIERTFNKISEIINTCKGMVQTRDKKQEINFDNISTALQEVKHYQEDISKDVKEINNELAPKQQPSV